MEDYSAAYKRLSDKGRKVKPYRDEQLNEIIIMLNQYFEKVPPKGKLKNPANFEDLANDVNNFYRNFIVNNNADDVIKGKYICEIYNGTNLSETKSIKKIETLKQFLIQFIETDGLMPDPQNKTQTIEIADWKGTINNAAPQWADHLEIPLENNLLKSFSCDVQTSSPYYRFGVKLFSRDGKLFGDASIQSQLGVNLLIHVAKNFESEQLFVASYKNGIRLLKNQNINVFSDGQSYSYKLKIDDDGFLLFYINEQQIYKILIQKEILQRICLYVWGDCFDPDPEVNIKNIKIETAHP